MLNFSLWNNGRSVINLDTIERIDVLEKGFKTATNFAQVRFISGCCKIIDEEEYQFLMKRISK